MTVYKDTRRGRLKWRYHRLVTLADGTKVRIHGTPAINTRAAALSAEHAHVERTLHPVARPVATGALPPAVDPPEPRAGAGWIYFLTDGELVKIGYSVHVARRLAGLQTSNPRELRLVKALPGTLDDEADLHDRYRRHRVRGEWFDMAPVFEGEGIA